MILEEIFSLLLAPFTFNFIFFYGVDICTTGIFRKRPLSTCMVLPQTDFSGFIHGDSLLSHCSSLDWHGWTVHFSTSLLLLTLEFTLKSDDQSFVNKFNVPFVCHPEDG
jgi:hypothetical protein